jgi:hypothetical protein
MVKPDKERSNVGGAFITLNDKMRQRLWERVHKKAPAPKGIKVKPGAEWLKPGLIGRARHLKGEQQLRHATLRETKSWPARMTDRPGVRREAPLSIDPSVPGACRLSLPAFSEAGRS